jgi:UDP-N-acetylmuramate dehydrogenase
MNLMTLDLKKRLTERFGSRVQFDAPMDRHTSFRVGGPADALVTPKDRAELMDLLAVIRAAGVPWMVLGGGTNLLVKDRGIRGVVICPGRGFDQIQIRHKGPEKTVVEAGAAVRLSALCRYAIDNNYTGLHFAAGIPGSVGGAILMNAGTRQGAVESVLEGIDVLESPDRVRSLDRNQLFFGYRRLSWQPAGNGGEQLFIVLSGRFALAPAAGSDPAAEFEAMLSRRWETQPKGFSAGCVFKNPSADMAAGRLIDQAGLRGMDAGGARVSAVHANFIINENNATAADILELIGLVQKCVADRFRVCLEPEIRIVGE